MRPWIWFALCGLAVATAAGGWMLRGEIRARLAGFFISPVHDENAGAALGEDEHHHDDEAHGPAHNNIVRLSTRARKNLGLVVLPVKRQSYWRTVLIPGEVIDRPGLSDRGVTSPAVGVVTDVHAFPGDTVRPGQPLFTVRVFSEYLQNTQAELFKATREIELAREQIARYEELARTGGVPESKRIELKNEVRRQEALILAYRQDLLTRGLSPEQVERVAEGEFVKAIVVAAPPMSPGKKPALTDGGHAVEVSDGTGTETVDDGVQYEVQELAVELGQQVQAGQLMARLSNHQSLYVVGRAFKRDASFLEQAAQERRPVEVEFAEDDRERWPALEQRLEIRHLANSIDPESRTFDFFIPLVNQSRGYQKDGEEFLVWRFRPGQRARLYVPVEELHDVYVVPAAAVVRDGPEAYLFRQIGSDFERRPVHLVHSDRRHAVIADDGSLKPGMFVVQSAASSLNRILKSRSAGEESKIHVHADGSVHEH